MRIRFVCLFVSCIFASSFIFQANTHAADLKEWTVLVYENGNNDLDEFITLDLNDMEKVGSSDRVNFVAEWGSQARRKVVRMKMQKDGDDKNVTSPVLQDRGLADMGDYREVVDFVKWGVQKFPAKHYALIISDHGAGWRATGGQIVSIDEFSGHGIHLPQLALISHEIQKILGGRKLDLMGFDACLMAMVEVAAEFWGMADYLVASQEVEPGYGWDYVSALRYFQQYPTSTPAALGQAIVQSYLKSYQGGSQGNEQVTMSLIDLSQLDLIAKDLMELAKNVTQKTNPQQKLAISKAIQKAQHYYNSDYIDLENFYALVRNSKSLDPILSKKWFADSETRLKKTILVNGVTQGYNKSHGLSIWGPTKSYFQKYGREYQATRFDRGTHWSTMLSSLYQNLEALRL